MATAGTVALRRPHQTWSNWPSFILAVSGSAVGLGNIWKFPYITGENGGGAFVLVYLACIVAIGLPVMMAEIMLGRRGLRSPVNSMRALAAEAKRSPRWAWLGVLLVAAAWTSSISMLEALVEWLQERGFARKTATFVMASAAWLVGVTTVLSFNEWSGYHPLGFLDHFAGKTLFDLYDFLTANIMLPLGALLMAVFAGWVMARQDSEAELAMGPSYGIWRPAIRYVAPAGIAVVFVANFL